MSYWMSSNLLSLNPTKTEFLIFVLPNNSSLHSIILPFIYLTIGLSYSPHTDSARNLGAILDTHLSFAQHISAVSISRVHNIRVLRRIRNTIDQTTACTVATSLIHSKIDYCNYLLLNLLDTQSNSLQLVLNSTARAVTKTDKCHYITSIIKALHWLKVNERINYNVISQINLSKLMNPLTPSLFFHSLHIVLISPFLMSALVPLLSTFVLNCKQIFLSYFILFV